MLQLFGPGIRWIGLDLCCSDSDVQHLRMPGPLQTSMWRHPMASGRPNANLHDPLHRVIRLDCEGMGATPPLRKHGVRKDRNMSTALVIFRWCFALLVCAAMASGALVLASRVYVQWAAHARGVDQALGRLVNASYWRDVALDLPYLTIVAFALSFPFAFVISGLHEVQGRVPSVFRYSMGGVLCALFWVFVFAIVYGGWIAEQFSIIDILERAFTIELGFILLSGAFGGYCFARMRKASFNKTTHRHLGVDRRAD